MVQTEALQKKSTISTKSDNEDNYIIYSFRVEVTGVKGKDTTEEKLTTIKSQIHFDKNEFIHSNQRVKYPQTNKKQPPTIIHVLHINF